MTGLWYNIFSQEERVLRKGTPARSVKKITKPLDKFIKICYNKLETKERDKKMEKTYTESEIKAYFEYLIKKYPNSVCAEQADAWLYRMFNKDFSDRDTLEYIVNKIKENQK